jgi:uncharacterized protein (DUF433 family)
VAAAPRAHMSARIVRNPRICGGEPIVEGTRVPVRSVVITYQFYRDIERVQRAYPALDQHAIQVALAYYAAHRLEIDLLIDENERAIESAD